MSNEIIRGYEVVNQLGVSVMRFKPTIWGAKCCAATVKWLADRHPKNGYAMRAVVSIGREEPKDGPLVLESDSTTVDDLDATATAELTAGVQDQP